MSAPTNDTAPSGPSGPVGRYLRDPGAAFERLAERLLDFGSAVVPLAPFAVALFGATTFAVAFVRARHRKRRHADARWLDIALPPKVDPGGAGALWTNLHALVRPAWKRVLYGQPHLGFEYIWCGSACRIGLWVPADVSMNLVRRAVEAAWPACRTKVFDEAPTPLFGEATGGTLGLVEPSWFGLRTDHDTDPLRAVLGAAGGLDADEYAVVQVLARPLPTSRLGQARRAARVLRTGMSTNVLDRLANLVVPTTTKPSDDPSRAADVRAVLDKASSSAWAVTVRYGVSTKRTSGNVESRRSELRGRAHALASAFALYAGRNSLGRHRLRRPVEVLATRELGRGELLSVPELAALAHLPLDVPVAGLERARARTVAPPPAVPSMGKVLGPPLPALPSRWRACSAPLRARLPRR